MNVFEKCNHNVHKLRQEFVQLIIDSENKSKHKGLFKNVVDFIEEVKKNKTLWKRLEEILRKAKRKMKGKNLTMVTIENELASTLADLREINGFVLDYMEEKKIENRKTILTNLENKKEKDNEVKIKNYDDAMNKVLFNSDPDCKIRNANRLVAFFQWIIDSLLPNQQNISRYERKVTPAMLIFYSQSGGTGKGRLLNSLIEALKELGFKVGKINTSELMGKFSTGIIKTYDVAFCMEFRPQFGISSGDNHNIEKLNNIIDREDVAIERKGVDREMWTSNVSVICATNVTDNRLKNRRYSFVQFNEVHYDELKEKPTDKDLVDAFKYLIINTPTPEEAYFNVAVDNENEGYKERSDLQKIYDVALELHNSNYGIENIPDTVTISVRTLLQNIVGKNNEVSMAIRKKYQRVTEGASATKVDEHFIIEIKKNDKNPAWLLANLEINMKALGAFLEYSEAGKVFTSAKFWTEIDNNEEINGNG